MAHSNKSEGGVTELSQGNISLCRKLYGALKSNSGNIFYSPASLEIALALLYAGTDGKTAKEIQSALLLPEPKEKTYAAVYDVLKNLTASKNVTLNIADGLFIHKDFKVKQGFVDVAKKYFASEVVNVNFPTEEAVKTINGFVAKETRQKITELFQSDSFDALTRLVIVNAIYFKGNWASKFDPKNTYKSDFHINKKDKVTVDFMMQEKELNVGFREDLDANIIVLPYQDDKLSMVLIVPNEIEGLAKLEEKILDIDLAGLVKDTYRQTVVLSMPKFKLAETLNLKSILCNIGMGDMFSDKANLSGISDDPLYVSNVVQKTYIEVNEEGSEAAAATGVVMALRMMPLPPKKIDVNMPFLFFIYDSNERVLFMGRLMKP